jgi:hypothetical protein
MPIYAIIKCSVKNAIRLKGCGMVFVFPRIWLKDEACLCFFCIKIPYNGQESNHQALLSRKNINISQVDFMIEWEFGVC